MINMEDKKKVKKQKLKGKKGNECKTERKDCKKTVSVKRNITSTLMKNLIKSVQMDVR